ncbi:sulfite exporter TauE/SafE family protein [Palleronia caenipelagi]|uniref:Probable membrane transporter protein n=1 Tax=Palleronia caenipelagi TaxID=2489174 RepID=A0A547PLQ5_9RHOB|nr:sulfite exporter TauE/SafE family protein [Palleronia caenipelagi]TRD15072.1 sulfite exporter TauE/SafE family protein [Palleronia caenipelagi]
MIFDLLTAPELLVCLAVAVVAGFIKGAVGFAMPLVLVAGMTLVIDPKLAIAGLILPTVASNFVQVAKAGWHEAVEGTKYFWRFLLAACVMILAVTQVVPLISAQAVYLAVGFPVLILSIIQLMGVHFHVDPAHKTRWDWVIGTLAGTIGGIAGNWGPPTVLYLIALETERKRQMAVQGVVYGAGSIMLLAGHLSSGLLTSQTMLFSATLLIPAWLGMQLGFRFGDRLDPKRFRQMTLLVLSVAALNLLRKGFFG